MRLRGPLHPGDNKALLSETTAFLLKQTPLHLDPDLGRRLLQNMVEQNGTGIPANQFYFVVNARDGFFDPQTKDQARGKNYVRPAPVLWELDTNRHLGYLPLTLQGIVRNRNFKKVLDKLAEDIYSSLLQQHRFNNLPQDAVHVLFWCNQGCHRSVGWCRLASIAAEEWGWTNPSCN